MFGLFTPSRPLDLASKTWVERRMLWFAERFGTDRFRNARVVTPTDEFFPDRYTGDIASVRRCLDRMCGYIGVDPAAITVELLPDEAMPGAAGLYEMRARGHIRVADSQVGDPTRLLATLAHEIAHEILLRGGHLTGAEADHETTTDLLPAFLGVGIFAANGTIREWIEREGYMSIWWTSRQGYLSSIVHGYAMALFAHARGEGSPAWRHHLRADARKTLASGLRFLRKTGDSLFTPDTTAGPQVAPAAPVILERLAARSPTFKLAALWDVIETSPTDPHVLEAVTRFLTDRDDTLRASAAQAVAAFGPGASGRVTQLLELLRDAAPQVRAAAARALGTLKPPSAEVVVELARLLTDRDVSDAAAEALHAYGAGAAPALPKLLVALERALVGSSDAAVLYFSLLRAISTDPRKALREHFDQRDPDQLRFALMELKRTA